ncbi:hypothetical protein DC498_16965 [Terrimonas sp.]|uniref:hypothetical protein n=1 Tax=Terrimonas sp. TaxID=1914338 RepID=UPI000D52008A|nr:hypothetical protein [Terrimonas sp.]PVD51104.1 hypothetical protein DC498_16965 [Terrimonas sp.]
MDTNHVAKEQILQIVENQLKNNDPPETKQTYDRLLKSGITEEDTRIYIGQCEAVEIFDIMKYQRPFNKKRFIENLNKLPEEPFE